MILLLFWGIHRDHSVKRTNSNYVITFIAAGCTYFYINTVVIKNKIKIITIKYGPIGFYRFCAIYTVLSER